MAGQPFIAHARRALEENLWSMWRQFGQGPGCALHEDDGLLWFETPIPVLPYNLVIRFRVQGDADSVIDALFAHFRARGVPFLWYLHPSVEPRDLTQRLATRGLEELEPIAGMAAELHDLPAEPEPPAGVEIHRVTPDRHLDTFLALVASRWSVPIGAQPQLLAIARQSFRIGASGSTNRAWLAMKDGQALAKVFTHSSDGVVGIYGMATQVEARGMGLGRLLCVHALADARDRGDRLAVLHSTPMAVHLYRSVGFREVAPFSIVGEPGAFYA